MKICLWGGKHPSYAAALTLINGCIGLHESGHIQRGNLEGCSQVNGHHGRPVDWAQNVSAADRAAEERALGQEEQNCLRVNWMNLQSSNHPQYKEITAAVQARIDDIEKRL